MLIDMQNSQGLANSVTVKNFYYKSDQNLKTRLSTWQLYGLNKISLSEYIVNEVLEKKEFPKNWLDIGCGTGELLEYLNKKSPNLELFGIDISKAMVDKTKRILPSKFKKNIVEADALNLPFFELTFDFISIVHVLHHIPKEQLKLFLNKIFDKVSIGGNIVISLPKFVMNQGLNKIHYDSLQELNFPTFMKSKPTTYYSSKLIKECIADQDFVTEIKNYKNKLIFPSVQPVMNYYQTAMMYRGSNGPTDKRISSTQWLELEAMVRKKLKRALLLKRLFIIPGDVEIVICQKIN
jgi:ubiquinone/menaquinone biosynthesis C-methylase UbiE